MLFTNKNAKTFLLKNALCVMKRSVLRHQRHLAKSNMKQCVALFIVPALMDGIPENGSVMQIEVDEPILVLTVPMDQLVERAV